jgi:hypothetical protein
MIAILSIINEGKKLFTFCLLHFSWAGNKFPLASCASPAIGGTTNGSDMFFTYRSH